MGFARSVSKSNKAVKSCPSDDPIGPRRVHQGHSFEARQWCPRSRLPSSKLDTARPRHCHPVAPSLPPLCNTCSIVDTPTAQIAPESDPDKPRCHSQ